MSVSGSTTFVLRHISDDERAIHATAIHCIRLYISLSLDHDAIVLLCVLKTLPSVMQLLSSEAVFTARRMPVKSTRAELVRAVRLIKTICCSFHVHQKLTFYKWAASYAVSISSAGDVCYSLSAYVTVITHCCTVYCYSLITINTTSNHSRAG